MPPSAAPGPALQWPDDRPLDEAGRRRHDDYRLDPVIAALESQLAAWLATPATERPPVPPRIGLFGSLGQGKSTVVGNVLAGLSRGRKWRQRLGDWLNGPRIARFDVSLFKADDLEWRFYAAVLWRRVLRNIAVLMLLFFNFTLLLLLVLGIPSGWGLLRCLTDPGGCMALLGTWIAPVLAIFMVAGTLIGTKWLPVLGGASKAWAAVDPGAGIYVAFRDRAVRAIAARVGALPEIVVVDDLDRAAVEQQRGFLRALSRFSQGLGFALVVSMDESELLAAEPSPEAPAELLRKTLTVELRVPECTREDVTLLAAVCAREFARMNCRQHPELAYSLSSVQFVADLMRTLLLTTIDGPVQPRRVWRLLSGVAERARQLGVSGVDDLSALLRIEGLVQLAPGLRRGPDALRKALEANRVEALATLLAALGITGAREQAARDFFERTRMLQPGVRDGWFRLLTGFGGAAGQDDPELIWCAAWPMAPRSVDFFRLFIEAIELDALGYGHDLVLAAVEHPNGGADGLVAPGFSFSVPGGYMEYFSSNDLPEQFLSLRSDYLAECWLLWVCALVTRVPAERHHRLYLRAHEWLRDTGAVAPVGPLDLFWRECLADSTMWGSLTPEERDSLWRLLWEDIRHHDLLAPSLVERRRVFGKQLAPEDFAAAWRLLSLPMKGHSRDGRSALFWMQGLTPNVALAQLADAPNEAETALPATVWPAPTQAILNGPEYPHSLNVHFLALKKLHDIYRNIPVPQPLMKAWEYAQAFIKVNDCVAMIHGLAFDSARARGQRWTVALPDPWIQAIDGPLKDALKALINEPLASSPTSPLAASLPTEPGAGPAAQPLGAEQWTALILIAARRDWEPSAPESLFEAAVPDALLELCRTLEARGELPEWLRPVLT